MKATDENKKLSAEELEEVSGGRMPKKKDNPLFVKAENLHLSKDHNATSGSF